MKFESINEELQADIIAAVNLYAGECRRASELWVKIARVCGVSKTTARKFGKAAYDSFRADVKAFGSDNDILEIPNQIEDYQGTPQFHAAAREMFTPSANFEAIPLMPVSFTPEVSSDYEIEQAVPDFQTKATSVLYKDGKEVLKWVKSDKNNDTNAARKMIEGFAAELPRITPASKKRDYSNQTLAVYPMGDPHFGMFAWGEESGADFDLKIAEYQLCAAVDRLVDTAPACEEALIVNLGDFFHADNNEGKTARSGHSLDTDTRWAKVLRVGISAIRQCINSALAKHQKVSVINTIGNHDDHTAMFLSVALSNIYENEPRINIIDNPTIKHYYRFGKNLIGVHHGHTIKMDKLPFQMAIDRAADWSETTFRYWLTGHIHHDSVKEFNGVKVESFRTLAPVDAWHASMGYGSGRDMKCLVLHKDFGEIERHTVGIESINQQAVKL